MSILQELRLNNNMSQSDLARTCNISMRCIQDYEQGRRKLQSAESERIYNMAKALNTRMETLLEKDLL